MARDAELHCDALLFDMDGTLVDSTLAVERQWRRWAARHGLDPAPILSVAHGRRTLDTLKDVAPHLATEQEAASFDAEEAEEREGVVAVPGAPDLLGALPVDRWAVVTSAGRYLARERLGMASLPIPAALVSADDVRRGKPDPEGYLAAAVRLGFKPDRCIVLEDTPAGIEAGIAAGMPVIAVMTTYPADALGRAVAIVKDLRGVEIASGGGGMRVRIAAPVR